ncbi:hypothetical protein OIU84_029165 [Salix udensis]|uniref:Uncharacterized protein n=1 Tax=Salix udensis TaxID=889485 RepID=A0AAD6K8Q7_9ROSI|nr:hypothetical protein OIU84_029165 [Salix udensis]
MRLSRSSRMKGLNHSSRVLVQTSCVRWQVLVCLLGMTSCRSLSLARNMDLVAAKMIADASGHDDDDDKMKMLLL